MSRPTHPDYPTAFPTILLAVQAFDLARVVDVLDAEADRHGLDAVVDDVIFPALRTVGSYWAAGSFSVTHEHLFTAAATRWLHARLNTVATQDASRGSYLAAAPRWGGRAIVLAAGPDDLHVIGLDCLELLLAARGVRVCNLGALVPTDALVATATALDAAAVVVCSHTGLGSSAASTATGSLRAVHATGVTVFYAGSAFDSAFIQRRIPGIALDHSVADSARLLARLVDRPPTGTAASLAARAAHSAR